MFGLDLKLTAALVLGGLAAFNAYQLRGARLELSDYKLSIIQANERVQAKKNADLLGALRSNRRIEDAQRDFEQWLEKDRAAVSSSNDRLRDTVARLNRRQQPGDTTAAKYAHEASTARSALEQCSARYRWMDGEAKKLGGQVIGLHEYINNTCRPLLQHRSAPPPDDLKAPAPDESGL